MSRCATVAKCYAERLPRYGFHARYPALAAGSTPNRWHRLIPSSTLKNSRGSLSMSDIAERVKKIVVEHLGVDEAKVTEGASFIDDLGADSLDTEIGRAHV